MAHRPDKRWGLLGGLRTDGPGERPPEPTLRNAVAESGRLLVKLAGWAAAACVAAGAGYLGWGVPGAWYGAAAVCGLLVLRLVGEVVLRAFGEAG